MRQFKECQRRQCLWHWILKLEARFQYSGFEDALFLRVMVQNLCWGLFPEAANLGAHRSSQRLASPLTVRFSQGAINLVTKTLVEPFTKLNCARKSRFCVRPWLTFPVLTRFYRLNGLWLEVTVGIMTRKSGAFHCPNIILKISDAPTHSSFEYADDHARLSLDSCLWQWGGL